MLRDVATGLAGQGIPKLVILNGHGGNDFRQMIRELQPAVSLFLCTVNWYQVVDPKLFFEDLGDHAGELETSVMLHLAPELVRPLSEAGPGRARRFTITALREGWAWAPRRWRQVTDGATACPTYMSRAAAITALRAGTNGWTCMPTNPANEGNEPMCVDEQWMAFMQALETKATPHVKRVRVGYMIAPGGAPGSNTDPFAKAATPTNEWGYDPPHVMLLATDLNELEGIPTKSPSTQALVLRDVATGLAGQGIPKLVILNGHGGNDRGGRLSRCCKAEAVGRPPRVSDSPAS